MFFYRTYKGGCSDLFRCAALIWSGEVALYAIYVERIWIWTFLYEVDWAHLFTPHCLCYHQPRYFMPFYNQSWDLPEVPPLSFFIFYNYWTTSYQYYKKLCNISYWHERTGSSYFVICGWYSFVHFSSWDIKPHHLTLISNFGKFSGFSVNWDKSEIMPISEEVDMTYMQSTPFKKAFEDFSYLGVIVTKDPEDLLWKNWHNKIEQLKQVIHYWKTLPNSLVGEMLLRWLYGHASCISFSLFHVLFPSLTLNNLIQLLYLLFGITKPLGFPKNIFVNLKMLMALLYRTSKCITVRLEEAPLFIILLHTPSGRVVNFTLTGKAFFTVFLRLLEKTWYPARL